MRGGTRERAWHGRGVALVGSMHLGGDHSAGIEVHRMFRLVGEMRAAIFQLGDPGIRIGQTLPVGIGQLLALAMAIQADQVFGRRCLDAAVLGHPRQHLTIAFTGLAPNDRAQRRVGFHR